MNKFWKIVFVALFFRVVFAFVVWHPDVTNHIDWGIRFFEYGPSKFYSPEANVWSFTWPNQPPGTIYLFAGVRKIFEIVFGIFWWLNIKVSVFPSGIITFFESNLYPAMLKFPAILADFGIAFLIYKIIIDFWGSTSKNKHLARAGALMFLLNPVVWYNSSVWGQYDSLVNFFGFLAFYLLTKKRLSLALLSFGVSIYLKISLAIFFPIFLLVIWRQKYKFKELLGAVSSLVVAIGVFTYPFSRGEPFSWLYELYVNKVLVNQMQVITANAFNFWDAAKGIYELPHNQVLGFLTYKSWGIVLFTLSCIPPLFAVIKRPNSQVMVWSFALVAFSTFMLLTNMHERYLYPLFPFLTIIAIKNRKLLPAYWGVVLVSLFNHYHLWYTPRIEPIISLMSIGDRLVPRLLGFVMVGLYAVFYRHFLRQSESGKI